MMQRHYLELTRHGEHLTFGLSFFLFRFLAHQDLLLIYRDAARTQNVVETCKNTQAVVRGETDGGGVQFPWPLPINSFAG